MRHLKNRRLFIYIALFFSLGCGVIDNFVGSEEATESQALVPTATRTPWPTFTPSPTIDLTQLAPTATPTSPPLPPTDTPPPPPPADTPTPPPPTNTPPPPAPQVRIGQTLNIRSGPGTSYSRVGQVTSGHTSDVLGRNNNSDWVLINYSGGQGWVYVPLIQVDGNLNGVDVVQVQPPPPPPPTPTPVPQQAAPAPPSQPAGPSYPYKLVNMFGERNGAITQIRGFIKDKNGNPADGLRVRVRIGSFCTVAVPSGKPGVYPAGNYDILLRPYASDGVWQVSIVDKPTNPDDNSCDPGAIQLSEEVRAVTSTQEGVTYVEFQAQ